MKELHLLQGTLDLLVLRALNRGPRYGYQIAANIQRGSRQAFRVLDGALYTSLHRLEDRGWVTSVRGRAESGRAVRVYALTPQGRAGYRTEATTWMRYVTSVARVFEHCP